MRVGSVRACACELRGGCIRMAYIGFELTAAKTENCRGPSHHMVMLL